MIIYKKYKPPPEPPKHLWLIIDLKKLKFNTNKDLYYTEYVVKSNPELYTEVKKMYKKHNKKKHNKKQHNKKQYNKKQKK